MTSSPDPTVTPLPDSVGMPFELSRKEIRMLRKFLDSHPRLVLQHPSLIGLSGWLNNHDTTWSYRTEELDDTVCFTLSLRQWETMMFAAASWEGTPGAGLWAEAEILVGKLKDVELAVRVADSIAETN